MFITLLACCRSSAIAIILLYLFKIRCLYCLNNGCQSCTLYTTVCVNVYYFTYYSTSACVVDAGDPASYELVDELVRPHLSDIMRKQDVTAFPYEQHCYCDGPAGGRMVQCDMCNRWFHRTCISGVVGCGDWLCRQCK